MSAALRFAPPGHLNAHVSAATCALAGRCAFARGSDRMSRSLTVGPVPRTFQRPRRVQRARWLEGARPGALGVIDYPVDPLATAGGSLPDNSIDAISSGLSVIGTCPTPGTVMKRACGRFFFARAI